MVSEACLPSNAYYPRTPDYTLCSGVHVCWSEHSDLSLVYGFMSLDYGLGTMTATTSLTASLMTNLLTVVAKIFSNTLIFLLQATHIFSAKHINVFAIFKDRNFNVMLASNLVKF